MSVSAFPYGALVGGGAQVTLTNSYVEKISTTGGIAGFRFNSDGTIDNRIQTTYTQINASTDWIIPNGAAPDDYEIMMTYTGDAPTGTASYPASTWLAFSTYGNPEWYVDAISDKTQKDCVMTIQIRKGSGPVLASATFEMYSENT